MRANKQRWPNFSVSISLRSLLYTLPKPFHYLGRNVRFLHYEVTCPVSNLPCSRPLWPAKNNEGYWIVFSFDILILTTSAAKTESFLYNRRNQWLGRCILSLVQVYYCGRANGNGFRSKDSCDFAVKPEDGRDVNGFSCLVEFQQEGGDDDHKYSIYVNPGFTPLRVEKRSCFWIYQY